MITITDGFINIKQELIDFRLFVNNSNMFINNSIKPSKNGKINVIIDNGKRIIDTKGIKNKLYMIDNRFTSKDE